MNLSVCLVVRNEEAHLSRCLDSVKALNAELVVVDTGSIDNTPDIAAGYCARVFSFDFTRVDFAAARNYGLAQAKGRWILALDADESLREGDDGIIHQLVAGDGNAGYFVERHNHSSDSQTGTIDYLVRLFPNRGEYRYKGRVHETIDKSILAGGGKLQKTNIRIDHSFGSDPEARRRKNYWYIEILKEEMAADPTDDSRLDFLAAEYHQLGMFDEATEIAERIVEMRPSDARAHLFVGLYHLLYKANAARALGDFDRALALRPGYAEAESFRQLANERLRVGKSV